MNKENNETEKSFLTEKSCLLPNEDVNVITESASWRSSKYLVITVVFIAMSIELIILTTLEPLLPDLLYKLHHKNHPLLNETSSQNDSYSFLSTTKQGGVILGIKPGVEMIINFLFGYIVDKYGHKWPMAIGCVCNMLATLGFAFGSCFIFLIISRIFQAIGSSLSIISALSLLSEYFTEGEERDKMNGIANLGISLGIIIGFPFGSTMYYFFGRVPPFAVIAGLMLVDGTMRLLVKVPKKNKFVKETVCDVKVEELNETKAYQRYLKLLTDPIVLIVLCFCNCIIHIGLGVVISTEAAWMKEKIKLKQWTIGIVLLSGTLFQVISQLTVITCLLKHVNKSLIVLAGMLLFSIGLLLYPFCEAIYEIIIAESFLRTGFGLGLCVICPLLADIADISHNSNYGTVFGLYGTSYNLGLAMGPIIGGFLLHFLGFDWLYWLTATCIAASSLTTISLNNRFNLKISSHEDDNKIETEIFINSQSSSIVES